jgi:hypothetical protein
MRALSVSRARAVGACGRESRLRDALLTSGGECALTLLLSPGSPSSPRDGTCRRRGRAFRRCELERALLAGEERLCSQCGGTARGENENSGGEACFDEVDPSLLSVCEMGSTLLQYSERTVLAEAVAVAVAVADVGVGVGVVDEQGRVDVDDEDEQEEDMGNGIADEAEVEHEVDAWAGGATTECAADVDTEARELRSEFSVECVGGLLLE